MGRGVGVDPDHHPVGERDCHRNDRGAVVCHTGHCDVSFISSGRRRCRRRPGNEVTTRQACNGSQPESFQRHWLDMLLINHPGGPGSTPTPEPDGQIPGKTPRRDQAIHESRPIRRTAANPASQPQASHHEHLQAIQSGVFCGPQLVGVRRGVSVRQIHNRWPTTWSSFDTCRRSRAGRWEWSPCLTASPDTRSSWS